MTIGTIIGIIFGITMLGIGFYYLKLKILVENTPTSKIRSIAMGLVEIFGSVVPIKLLKSPFTNKECIGYKYTIEEYKSSGKENSWQIIKQGDSRNNFYLKDDTGNVLVNLIGAQLDIPRSYFFDSGFGKDPQENIKKFLKENNMNFENFLGINKRMKYSEYIISPNDKLYILGTAADNPNVEEGTAVKGSEDIIIQKGKYEKIFYISANPEKELVSRLKKFAFGFIIFGVFLILISTIVSFIK